MGHNLLGIKANGLAQVSLGNPHTVASKFNLAGEKPGLRGCGVLVGYAVKFAEGVVRTFPGHVDLGSERPVPGGGDAQPR